MSSEPVNLPGVQPLMKPLQIFLLFSVSLSLHHISFCRSFIHPYSLPSTFIFSCPFSLLICSLIFSFLACSSFFNSVWVFFYLSHHLVHNVSLLHSLASVFFFRRITVKSNSWKKMLKKLSQRPSQPVLQLKRYLSELPICYNSRFTLHSKQLLSPQILSVFSLLSLICNRELLPRSRTNNLKVCNFLLLFYPCCFKLVVSLL